MVTPDVSRLTAALTLSAVLHGVGLYGLSVLGAGGDGTAGGRRTVAASQPLQATLRPLPPVVLAENKAMTAPPATDPEPTSSNPRNEPQLIFPGLHYFRLSEVDTPPAPLGDIIPDMAARNQLGKREGYLVLRVFISETGTVDKVEVVQAQPPGVFDGMEVPVFSAARFTPAVKDGKPVKSQMVAEIRYFDETDSAAQSSLANPSAPVPQPSPKPLQ